jgi:hypothetical protein
MTTEEFIKIMNDNASDFPEFAALSQTEKEAMANMNILTGPTMAFRNSEGRLDGVGGVRIKGVGEGWMITPRRIQSHPDFQLRRKQFQALLRDTRNEMKKMFDEHNLWRVYAIGKLSMTFPEHLGFERLDNALIWSRTK